jgi:hypothetical protein
MARNADVVARIVRLLMSRASVPNRTRGYRSRRGGEEIGLSRRPNAPRFVTILLAVALTVVGLALTVYEIKPVLDLLRDQGIEATRDHGHLALLASPALLVIGSFFRGI